MKNKSGWIFGTIMSLLVLIIVFLIGLSIGIASQGELNFSNDTLSSWVSALATVCIAVLTIFLAKETWALRQVQLLQIEQIRKEAIKPSIDVYLKNSPAAYNFIDVHIVNSGSGVAQNIGFSFSNKNHNASDVYNYLYEKFSRLSILATGISSLGSGEKRTSFLFSFIDLHNKFGEEAFELNADVLISFHDNEGKHYTSRASFNFYEYKGISEIGGGEPMYKISSILEKIQKDIGHFASGFKKLKTDVYTSQDRADERERWEKEWEELEAKKNTSS